ncbi:hypothetical protein FRAHR75_170100 [Frankia sp. Hr75.2]|nr:hypothetical protein FRAHR75_170100 [Frankia sp. Hr75.2]
MATTLDFPVFDADHHLYETEDAFTRHLPARHRDLFRFVELNGRKKMAFYSGDNPEGKSLRELTGTPMRSIPAFREPKARLEVLDEQGVHACLLFPTLASLVEERLRDDPTLTQVAIRAFNDWLHDDWTYNYADRILTTPIVSPCDVDAGIAELDRVLRRGARAILVRPAPVAGLRGPCSPFLPEFDPFWARVQEAGVLVALHASDSGYQEYLNTWEGSSGEYVAFRPRTFAHVADGGRTIQDTLASAICHLPSAICHLPRHARPLPPRTAHQRRERRQLGRHPRPQSRARPEENARGVPHPPPRTPAPQHLDQPVLGGLPRGPHLPHGLRPRLLRLRLSPPRRPRRAPLLHRTAHGSRPGRHRTGHVDQHVRAPRPPPAGPHRRPAVVPGCLSSD